MLFLALNNFVPLSLFASRRAGCNVTVRAGDMCRRFEEEFNPLTACNRLHGASIRRGEPRREEKNKK
jgi:hypothetical protein